jgi:hypothetical protein
MMIEKIRKGPDDFGKNFEPMKRGLRDLEKIWTFEEWTEKRGKILHAWNEAWKFCCPSVRLVCMSVCPSVCLFRFPSLLLRVFHKLFTCTSQFLSFSNFFRVPSLLPWIRIWNFPTYLCMMLLRGRPSPQPPLVHYRVRRRKILIQITGHTTLSILESQTDLQVEVKWACVWGVSSSCGQVKLVLEAWVWLSNRNNFRSSLSWVN